MFDIGQPDSDRYLLGPPVEEASEDAKPTWAAVPWRTIVGSVAVVLGTVVLVVLLWVTARIVTWVAIAGFFAIVLAPLVRRVQRHVGDRRTVATAIVVFSTLFVLVGVVTLFILPVRTQLVSILTDLPGTVRQAAQGKGPVGNLVTKMHIESYVKSNEPALARVAKRLDENSFQTAQTVLSAALAFLTITLLTFFFLSQAESMGKAVTNLLPRRRRASVKRGAVDAAAAVSGYVIGNLLVSAVAGVAGFVFLVAMGVPSPVVLALWVAVADLMPLVGATIGAAVCVLAAYLHSPTAGIAALVFFIVYQQIENSVIYPWIMAKKVNVSPLLILLSVLLGVEVFGLLGALLAVPVSGAMQVVVKAVRQERQREQLVLPDEFSEPLRP